MYNGRHVTVIIAAGGLGERFGSGVPKQFFSIGGKSMVAAATEAFLECGFADGIIIAAPEGFVEQAGELLERELGATIEGDIPLHIIPGGKDRAASVRAALEAAEAWAPGPGGLVLIHDAARPFVTTALIERVIEAADAEGAAIPVIPVHDTVYIEGESGFAGGVQDRSLLRAAQTPQGFGFELIRDAHTRAFEEGLCVTDDGKPVLEYGGKVCLVEGDPKNIKITLKADIPGGANEAIRDAGMRAGVGFDAHRFCDGRPLIIGGLEIAFPKGLDGHSDADVLTHSLIDAILGALGEGDIGKLFPDSDPAYKGFSSIKLLDEVVSLMYARGYEVVNADMTLVAEQPRMAPYRGEIEGKLAEALRTRAENVSFKATTTEKLGFTGREEGMAAEAVVLLRRPGIL